VEVLSGTLMGSVMRGLASDLATDPDLGDAFRHEVIALRRGLLGEIVEAAVDHGELRPDVDLEADRVPALRRAARDGAEITTDVRRMRAWVP